MEALKCLMLGCGHAKPTRRMMDKDTVGAPVEWTTLDMNSRTRPDVVFDLSLLDVGGKLPFADDSFNEIHAYEVLEHFGRQGDFKSFFLMWKEFWRVLKPKGYVFGSSPASNSPWAWGDPGHTRVIGTECLTYLVHDNYKQLGITTMTDYFEFVNPCWWLIGNSSVDSTFTHWYALQKDRRALEALESHFATD